MENPYPFWLCPPSSSSLLSRWDRISLWGQDSSWFSPLKWSPAGEVAMGHLSLLWKVKEFLKWKQTLFISSSFTAKQVHLHVPTRPRSLSSSILRIWVLLSVIFLVCIIFVLEMSTCLLSWVEAFQCFSVLRRKRYNAKCTWFSYPTNPKLKQPHQTNLTEVFCQWCLWGC